jgi:hypothetical protein
VNRENIESVEEENELEVENEEKRKLEFWNKFPKLNKIFIIWWICKWFWKEWLKYSLGLIIIILLWLWLRFTASIHLDTVIVEEQFHYIPAKNLVESWKPTLFYTSSEFMRQEEYYRTFLYTYITSIFFKAFWISELTLRLTAILFSILTWIIVYFISKYIVNKKAWLIWIGLFMVIWWAIWYWIFARHYVLDWLVMLILLFNYYWIFIKNKWSYWYYFFPMLITLISIPWIEIWNLIYVLFISFIVLIFDFKKVLNLFKDHKTYILIVLLLISLKTYINIEAPWVENIKNINTWFIDKLFEIIKWVVVNVYPLKFDVVFIKTMYNFYPILFIFMSISFISIFYLVFIKKINKYYIFLFFPIFLWFMSIYDPGKTWNSIQIWSWEPRHISIFIPLFIVYCSIIISIYLQILKKYHHIILIIIILLQINPSSLYNIKYWDNISWTPYQVLTSSAAYTDFKTPIHFIKNNFNDTNDLLIFDVMEVMYRSYWNKNPDKRIWWEQRPNQEYRDLYDNSDKLNRYIKYNTVLWKRIWLIESTYNWINYHTRSRYWKIKNYLLKNWKKCNVYSEWLVNIYLFTKECFKKQ